MSCEWNNDQFDFSVYPSDGNKYVLMPDLTYANDHYSSLQKMENNALRFGLKQYGATWIIEYGNMDYLKCPEQLQWDGQTSCK